MQFKTYSIVYWLFALGFILASPWLPYTGSFLIKVVPALTLAFVFLRALPELKGGMIMGVGYIFSAGGDLFLDLDRQANFIYGLSSFLVAHVLYTVTFCQHFKYQKRRLWLVLIMLGLCVGMGIKLTPNLGELLVPVMVYMLAITVMGVSAANVDSDELWIGLGALTFMLSDSVIAINRFLHPFSWAQQFIFTTYFTGNFLMGLGLVRMINKRRAA